MANELQGKRIAFIATDGVEQIELTEPWNVIQQAGGQPELISLKKGQIQTVNGMDKADTFRADKTFDQARAADYDSLVIPGGVANPDTMRMDERAVRFVRAFIEAGKPVAAICHGPWMLVEADVVRGRTVTSYPSLKTDIRNAGGMWVDEEVVTDRGLVTSRNPNDLPAFCRKMVEEILEGVHAAQAQSILAEAESQAPPA
ncbi:MAG TPA: type 1 glutamine amidotransferase domain-containing protein [Thermomicrobiales bacterium]